MKKNLQTVFQPRQYMLSRDFELFYYNDKNLTKVASHVHDYYEFCFFIEGDVSMQVGDITYPINHGDAMLIPPQIPHNIIIHDPKVPYRRFIFWISKDFYERLKQTSPNYTYAMDYACEHEQYICHLDRITFTSIQSKILRLLEEMHSDHFGKELQIALYVDDFILSINRLVYDVVEPKKRSESTSLHANVIDYIEEHLDEELTLDCLAEKFYVSKYHIAHVFKDNFGLSIHQYITKKRLALCQEAIRTRMNINEIYQTYGFGDYSSFYRAFKKEYGISPKEYRDMQENVIIENSKDTKENFLCH